MARQPDRSGRRAGPRKGAFVSALDLPVQLQTHHARLFQPLGRLYCVDDEAGTLICAYPEDRRRPAISAPYAEETMHGFEYQAAAHMIQEGMVEEGMRLVTAVRDRYDGERRNPWNEMECGSNYAAVWRRLHYCRPFRA